jgi:hypothetical protein
MIREKQRGDYARIPEQEHDILLPEIGMISQLLLRIVPVRAYEKFSAYCYIVAAVALHVFVYLLEVPQEVVFASPKKNLDGVSIKT